MNFQELLESVSREEAKHSMGVEGENIALQNQPSLQHQGNFTIGGSSKKTLEENQQLTLGEVTLEDFLLTAGVVAEGSSERKNEGSFANTDGSSSTLQMSMSQQRQWVQYLQPQSQYPQQNLMNVYMEMPQQMSMVGGNSVISMDVSNPEDQMCLPSSLIGTCGRKRSVSEGNMNKTVERRQKRMIKNRESAARSRARKQAYTNELEHKVSCLEEENERLRKQQELEKMLPCAPLPEPKYQLRRTSSSCF